MRSLSGILVAALVLAGCFYTSTITIEVGSPISALRGGPPVSTTVKVTTSVVLSGGALVAVDLPNGVTAEFSPAELPSGGDATMTLRVSASVAPGTYPARVGIRSGDTVVFNGTTVVAGAPPSGVFTLEVLGPSFQLEVDPQRIDVPPQPLVASARVRIIREAGFTAPVTLSATNCLGFSLRFDETSPADDEATLTVTSSGLGGMACATDVVGTGGNFVRRFSVLLTPYGSPDAGQPDAGMPDAGMPDAGMPDAGMPDAGVPDAGPPDAGWIAADVTAGWTHACALSTTGETWCWGSAVPGARSSAQRTPLRVPGVLPFTALAAGRDTTCGLTAAGDLYCWGSNALGLGGSTDDGGANLVSAGVAFASISMGGSHVCGLARDGGAHCWGGNVYGQLGLGFASTMATTAPAVPNGGPFVSITAGNLHTCALDLSGTASCWGELSGNTSTVPVARDAGVPLTALGLGSRHGCGAGPGGQTYCWGDNSSRQCGFASPATILEPTPIDAGLALDRLTGGSAFTCGLQDGGAWCWGLKTQGRLGSGADTFGVTATPLAVVDGHTFTRLTAGFAFACGLTAAGEIWCWGDDGYGQLGANAFGSSGTPTLIAH